jgi:hypothetical protein
VVVSFASGLAATVLFWVWLGQRGVTARCRRLALAALLLFAWGWYLYGVVYGDGLYLALALGSFLLAERRQLVAATLVGALATAVRPTAVTLVLGLLVLAAERDGALTWRGFGGRLRWPVAVDLHQLRPRHGLPLLSLAGVAAFSAYEGIRFGQPLLWLEVQDKWSQGPSAGPRSWFKLHMAARLIRVHELDYIVKNAAQAGIVLAVAISVPLVIRRFGLGYGAYLAGLVAFVAFGANDFVGAGRYMLAAFPAAAVLGEWLAPRRRATVTWLALSAAGLVVQTALFAHGSYLS